jgi:hypothetical protein
MYEERYLHYVRKCANIYYCSEEFPHMGPEFVLIFPLIFHSAEFAWRK